MHRSSIEVFKYRVRLIQHKHVSFIKVPMLHRVKANIFGHESGHRISNLWAYSLTSIPVFDLERKIKNHF